MPKNLLAFVDSSSEFSFCMRLRHALNAKGFRLVLLTPRPSLVLKSFLRSVPSLLIKNSDNSTADIHVSSTTEVLSREIEERSASRYYHGVLEILEKVHTVEGITVMLIRNGNSIPTKAMSMFAQQNTVATLYYEPSSIQGRLFVDPRGIDAQSLLFQKPEILSRFSVEDREFDQWRDSYLKHRSSKRTDILDSLQGRNKNSMSPIDLAGGLFFSLPAMRHPTDRHAAFGALQFDTYDTSTGTYNFFPMQASNDSRVVFNSSVSLQDAIEIAYDKSRGQQRDLLIQPHPYEHKKEILEYITSIRGKEGVFIANGSSYRFVEQCKELITINSVLAADALLAGKKVTFLGASYLAQMDAVRLKKYLLGYLIDIDYDSRKNISLKQCEAILSRLLLQ